MYEDEFQHIYSHISTTPIKIYKFPSPWKVPSCSFPVVTPHLPLRDSHYSDFYYQRLILPSLELRVNGIVWTLCSHFCLNIIFLKFIPIFVFIYISFFLLMIFINCINTPHFILLMDNWIISSF